MIRNGIAKACAAVVLTSLVTLAVPVRGAEAPAQRTAHVKIDNFTFDPPVLKIARGTKVTWVNADDVPHVVRSTDGVFKSPPMDTDGSFSYTFEKRGTFPYFCSLHPMMTGKIVVE